MMIMIILMIILMIIIILILMIIIQGLTLTVVLWPQAGKYSQNGLGPVKKRPQLVWTV